MNQEQKNRAQIIFEKFQTKNITESNLKQANEKAGNLGEKIADFKLLVSMLEDSIKGKFALDKTAMAIIVGAILYVVSPIDAIPDFIPITGWLDDIGIVGLAINQLSEEIQRYKRTNGL